MNNFEFYNPTKIIFGEGEIEKLTDEIPKDAKVLMTYGGGSIKRNGIYEQVTEALADFDVVEFGGIPSNPEYEVLLEALEVIKEEDIDFMLAVGGGSVIDGTKFLSAAAHYDGSSSWDLLSDSISVEEGLPFGTVLTLPATASEMNSGAVVSREETKEKLAMGGPGLFPQFSVLDPTAVSTVPKRQIANGITDAFTHVMEQYMTYPAEGHLQDRFAEGIMQTLIEVAPDIMADPSDYDAAANFMWSCTMALNGLIQKGVPGDWAVHAMGHELTALYGIDHARTLAILAPRHYQQNVGNKKEKLAQYAERVWDISEGDIDAKAHKAIEKTEEFFHSLDIDTRLSDYTDDFEDASQIIAERFKERGWTELGEHKDIGPDEVATIVEESY